MLYYASRISDNIRRREPEGYLICVNVPIARSGTQEYQQDEIGQAGQRLVTVYRPEDEVFSEATMSSFEGMPVTNDHPDTVDGVTIDNICDAEFQAYNVGEKLVDIEKVFNYLDGGRTPEMSLRDILMDTEKTGNTKKVET